MLTEALVAAMALAGFLFVNPVDSHNTGGVFGEDSELLRAEQTVLHDGKHPSRLTLPVVPR